MHLKKRYNKAFTSFIIFQFIILIFFIYFPMNSHFNKFREFYLNVQVSIFHRIYEKNKNDMMEKLIQSAIWEASDGPLVHSDRSWYEKKLANLTQDPTEIDSLILLDKNKAMVYSDIKLFKPGKEFLNSTLISQALENVVYHTSLIKQGDQYFMVAVTPVFQTTRRFDPIGVLILAENFNQYFLNQKIAAFMDPDLVMSISHDASLPLEGFDMIIPLQDFEETTIGNIAIKYNNLFFKNVKWFFLEYTIIGMVLLFFFFVLISYFISKKFAQRIEILNSEVENAVNHNFNYEIHVAGEDEISRLAQAFNEMATTMHDHVLQIVKTNEKLHDTYLEIIQGLITAIEVKDPYTKGHSYRVMRYSELIAKKMRYSSTNLEMIKMAALLHDIGKIGVPETILNKPGRLTSEEYEIVKAHPDYGYKILSNIEGFNRVKDIIRFHHERIDGKGYPCGMKDIVIPLESRIIAVADTFDAITSDRAYRKGMSVQEALTELQRVKGVQLDAQIVDLYVEVATEQEDFINLLKANTGAITDDISEEQSYNFV